MAYCKHYESNSGWFSTDYCNISGQRETIPSSYYSSCKNGGYGCPWYEKEYGTSSGCFITTVTCDILGKDDHDYVMDGLRKFRDEVLQKDEDYSSVLKLYDRVGPVISYKLFHDKDRVSKASKIYSRLENFVEIINNGNYKGAAKKYIIMTLKLVSEYGIQDYYRDLRNRNFGYIGQEFDISKAGHGKKSTKTLEN